MTCRVLLRSQPVGRWVPAGWRGLLPSLLLHITVLAVLPPFDIAVRLPAPEKKITVFLVDPARIWIPQPGQSTGVAGRGGIGTIAGRRGWQVGPKRTLRAAPDAIGVAPAFDLAVTAPELPFSLATPPPPPPVVASAANNLPVAGPPDEDLPELPGVVPVRVVHASDASFDVVIQSSASELLPEGSGVLGGAPVYTVYLPVGGGTQWILQYCQPTASMPQITSDSPIVTLGRAVAPTPPYPRVSYGFSLSVGRLTAKYVLIHGQLTASGHFGDLRVVNEGDLAWNRALLTLLSRWQFRPALLDGAPILVEILLAIPFEPS